MPKSLPLGHQIRAIRIARGWKLDDLAEKVGTTKATISKIERSTMGLGESWLRRFAEAFEMDVRDLFDGEPIKSVFVHIPIVGNIAAGNWREAIEAPDGYTGALNVSKDAFALRPEGDSMNLVVPEGALVVVEPNEVALRDGKIYCIMNGEGETTIKMFRADPARLEPRSTNEDHQPMMLGQHPFTVIGRVTQIMMTV